MKTGVYNLRMGDTLRGFKEANEYIAMKMLERMNSNVYPTQPEFLPAINECTDYLSRRFNADNGQINRFGKKLTNGTTEGFISAISVIKEKSKDFCDYVGFDEKPIILMPMPTYGLFHDAAERNGFEVRPVKRNKSGTPDFDDLLENVQRSLKEKRYIGAFFDSNPNNPTGAVRNKEETKKIASLFKGLNEEYRKISDGKAKKEWREENPNTKPLSECELGLELFENTPPNGPEIKSYLIDDLVCMGTEYKTAPELGAFLEFDKKAEFTVTLMGPSKIGLADIRAGIIIYPSESLHEINHQLAYTNWVTSRTVADGMTAMYGENHSDGYKAAREKHLKDMAEDCRERGLMMKALFNGINNTVMDAKDRKKIREDVRAYAPYGMKGHAEALLKTGIEHTEITTSPEAGFFHLIDLSRYKDKSFHGYIGSDRTIKVIKDNFDMCNYLYTFDVELRPSSLISLPQSDMTCCANFAINKEDIVGFALAMDSALKNVITPEPK